MRVWMGGDIWEESRRRLEEIEIWIDGEVYSGWIYPYQTSLKITDNRGGQEKTYRFQGMKTPQGVRIFEEVKE